MVAIIQDEGGTVKCDQCPMLARFHRFNFQSRVEEHICPNGHITETPEINGQPKKKHD